MTTTHALEATTTTAADVDAAARRVATRRAELADTAARRADRLTLEATKAHADAARAADTAARAAHAARDTAAAKTYRADVDRHKRAAARLAALIPAGPHRWTARAQARRAARADH